MRKPVGTLDKRLEDRAERLGAYLAWRQRDLERLVRQKARLLETARLLREALCR